MPNTLFNVTIPDFLWVADAPLAQGGVPRKVSIREAEELFSFHYTESLLSELPSSNFSSLKDTSPELTKTLLAYAKNAPKMIDKLVICRMEGSLGWGVFAREDIPEQTLIGIYAGMIEKNDEELNPYMLANGHGYYNNAQKTGGIARFFQHAPFNPEKWAEELSRSTTNVQLRKAIALYQGKTGKALHFSPSELSHVPPYIFLNMLREKKPQESEMKLRLLDFDSLEFHDPRKKDDTAWENIKSLPAVVRGVPLNFFVSTQLIKKGEIITFSYGLGYWLSQGIYPELFTTKGRVLPRSEYTRSIVPFSLPSIHGPKKVFFYPSNLFLECDMNTQRPVSLSPAASLISNFSLRQQLIQANALSQKFNPLEDNSFVIHLRDAIKRLNPNIKAFYRSPNKPGLDSYIVDIVCTFPDISTWIYFTKISRLHFGRDAVKAFQNTKEIIFSDVNNPALSKTIMNFIKNMPKLLQAFPPTTERELIEIQRETLNTPLYFWNQKNPRERLVLEEDREIVDSFPQFSRLNI